MTTSRRKIICLLTISTMIVSRTMELVFNCLRKQVLIELLYLLLPLKKEGSREKAKNIDPGTVIHQRLKKDITNMWLMDPEEPAIELVG